MAFPMAVALIGIAISFAFYITFEPPRRRPRWRISDDTGQELSRVLVDLQAIALEQVLAIQAFYESSSTVTHEEFDHFVDIVGGPADNQLAYAHRVTNKGLDAFLALARTSDPAYRLSTEGPATGDDLGSCSTARTTKLSVTPPGFDFGSDPAIRQAITEAFYINGAVASSFVSIPGDEEIGDVVIVSPISRSGAPVGVAVVTMTSTSC